MTRLTRSLTSSSGTSLNCNLEPSPLIRVICWSTVLLILSVRVWGILGVAWRKRTSPSSTLYFYPWQIQETLWLTFMPAQVQYIIVCFPVIGFFSFNTHHWTLYNLFLLQAIQLSPQSLLEETSLQWKVTLRCFVRCWILWTPTTLVTWLQKWQWPQQLLPISFLHKSRSRWLQRSDRDHVAIQSK